MRVAEKNHRPEQSREGRRLVITYIISDVQKSLAFEWIAQRLSRKHFDLRFILLNPSDTPLERLLTEAHLQVERITVRGKRDWPRAFVRLLWSLALSRPDVVHCHLRDATLLGLFAAYLVRVPARIYTRHHALIHHVEFKKGVWLDLFCNYLATSIVAISNNVRDILSTKESVRPDKIVLIPHGFHWADLQIRASEDFISRYRLGGANPIIGVIARWVDWKGVKYAIRAFREFQVTNPRALLVLANASGPAEASLQRELGELPPDSFRVIKFEPELGKLYSCFDAYIHVPVDHQVEAFGQTYVESLAAQIPSIFTLSGVANEFVEHDKNALVVDYRDSEGISRALLRIFSEPTLQARLKSNGWESVKERFSIDEMIFNLEKLYSREGL